uniref:Ribonuclease H-like domain-containing protein n=1 Tax=Tanacetum cinerariifolium TaxID=118510 RepID=A0A6L2NTJ2_TANCI|nr:ribonuclease H-like domain-containing protein [Tanacetum cinerariifolium]
MVLRWELFGISLGEQIVVTALFYRVLLYLMGRLYVDRAITTPCGPSFFIHLGPSFVWADFLILDLGHWREFSVARTPQQNSVAERKNRTLIEAARTMLADSKLPTIFWAEAVNTACYVQNRVLLIKPYNKTPYELFLGSKSSEDEVADDAEKKSTEVLRKENGFQDPAKEGDKNNQEKDLRDQEEALRKQFEQESERLFGQGEAANTNSTNRLNTDTSPVNDVSSSFTTVDPGRERAQRNEFKSMFGQDKGANGHGMFNPVSAVRSSYVDLGRSIYVNATTLSNADLPTDHLMPNLEDTADLQDTKIFIVISPIPITRIHKDHPKEQITGDPLLALRTRRMIKTSQEHAMMDVKSAFLYGTIEKEVYVCQPFGFKDSHSLTRINAQEVLDEFYEEAYFLLRVAETNKALLKDEEAEDVDVHLYRSMIGSLMYLTASRPDIMFAICACARFQVTPKVSHLHAVKRIFRYLKGQPKLGL